MEEKMKNTLLIILCCVLLIGITGCGNNNDDNSNNNSNTNNNSNNNNNNNSNNSEEDLTLYSDDTKIVFDFNNAYKMVFYYKGNNITGLEYYFDYGTAEIAKASVAAIKANMESDSEVKSVNQNGRYVQVTFKSSAYEDLTVEQVRTIYSYLKEVSK
jgi:uncharacterized protein YxeA